MAEHDNYIGVILDLGGLPKSPTVAQPAYLNEETAHDVEVIPICILGNKNGTLIKQLKAYTGNRVGDPSEIRDIIFGPSGISTFGSEIKVDPEQSSIAEIKLDLKLISDRLDKIEVLLRSIATEIVASPS